MLAWFLTTISDRQWLKTTFFSPDAVDLAGDEALEKTTSKPMLLPWWGTVIGYTLVAACIVNGGFWSYLYSMEWGPEISEEWLVSLLLSFFTSLFGLEPVKVSKLKQRHCVLFSDDSWSEDSGVGTEAPS